MKKHSIIGNINRKLKRKFTKQKEYDVDNGILKIEKLMLRGIKSKRFVEGGL